MLFQDLSFKRARALSENSSNDQTRYRVLCSSLVERQSAGTECLGFDLSRELGFFLCSTLVTGQITLFENNSL